MGELLRQHTCEPSCQKMKGFHESGSGKTVHASAARLHSARTRAASEHHPILVARPLAMRTFRVIPTREGYWYVSREDEAPRIFPTKQMAWCYAYTIATKYRPCRVIELTKDGREVTGEDFKP